MAKSKKSKTEVESQIKEFFSNINDKTPKGVRKIKRLAMSHNIPLKGKRKSFCKKCLIPYKNPKIRVKSGIKIVTCENCGYVSRWRIR